MIAPKSSPQRHKGHKRTKTTDSRIRSKIRTNAAADPDHWSSPLCLAPSRALCVFVVIPALIPPVGSPRPSSRTVPSSWASRTASSTFLNSGPCSQPRAIRSSPVMQRRRVQLFRPVSPAASARRTRRAPPPGRDASASARCRASSSPMPGWTRIGLSLLGRIVGASHRYWCVSTSHSTRSPPTFDSLSRRQISGQPPADVLVAVNVYRPARGPPSLRARRTPAGTRPGPAPATAGLPALP